MLPPEIQAALSAQAGIACGKNPNAIGPDA